VVHSQLGQKDRSKVGYVDYVSERLPWELDVFGFPSRIQYLDGLDVDVFDQGTCDAAPIAATVVDVFLPRCGGLFLERCGLKVAFMIPRRPRMFWFIQTHLLLFVRIQAA
jgi:hypothetical protein